MLGKTNKVVFNIHQGIRIKGKFNIFFKIPKELYNSNIRQFRIIPNYNGTDYEIKFNYEVDFAKTSVKTKYESFHAFSIYLVHNKLTNILVLTFQLTKKYIYVHKYFFFLKIMV